MQSQESKDEEREEQALILQAYRQHQKKMKELYPENAIVFKSTLEERRKSALPRYGRTLLRVQFGDNCVWQAYFSPLETLEDVFTTLLSCMNSSSSSSSSSSSALSASSFFLHLPPATKLCVGVTAEERKAQTLLKLGLVPTALLMIKWNKPGSPAVLASECLKPELLNSKVPLSQSTQEVPTSFNKQALLAEQIKAAREAKSALEAANKPAASTSRSSAPPRSDREKKLMSMLGRLG